MMLALKIIVAIGAGLYVIESQSAGPAPFAASELGLLARARYYMFHRRCWDLFLGFSIGELVLCALMDWPPFLPARFSRISKITAVATVSAFYWLGAGLLTAYENRDTSAEGEQKALKGSTTMP